MQEKLAITSLHNTPPGQLNISPKPPPLFQSPCYDHTSSSLSPPSIESPQQHSLPAHLTINLSQLHSSAQLDSVSAPISHPDHPPAFAANHMKPLSSRSVRPHQRRSLNQQRQKNLHNLHCVPPHTIHSPVCHMVTFNFKFAFSSPQSSPTFAPVEQPFTPQDCYIFS
eukprot:2370537-Rhodomonas_salina.2